MRAGEVEFGATSSMQAAIDEPAASVIDRFAASQCARRSAPAVTGGSASKKIVTDLCGIPICGM